MTLNVCTQERNRDKPKQKIPLFFFFLFFKNISSAVFTQLFCFLISDFLPSNKAGFASRWRPHRLGQNIADSLMRGTTCRLKI